MNIPRPLTANRTRVLTPPDNPNSPNNPNNPNNPVGFNEREISNGSVESEIEERDIINNPNNPSNPSNPSKKVEDQIRVAVNKATKAPPKSLSITELDLMVMCIIALIALITLITLITLFL